MALPPLLSLPLPSLVTLPSLPRTSCNPPPPTRCLQEHNDTLLAVLLATVTKGAAACNEIVDKVGGWVGRRAGVGWEQCWACWWVGGRVGGRRQHVCSQHWPAPPHPQPCCPRHTLIPRRGLLWYAVLQCNLAFDRISLKGGRKGGGGGGGGGGSTIGLGLPMGMLGGMGSAGFL